MMMTTRSCHAALAALALCGCGALLAPQAAHAQTGDEWKFQGTLYLYFPSIGGTTTYPPGNGGSSATVDSSTILENLKFTFMGSLEAQKGPWGVLTDVIYLNFDHSKSGSRGISFGGPLPVDVSADINLSLKGWLWTLAGTWRAVTSPTYRLDVVGGARMLDIDHTTTWQLSGNVGPIAPPDRAGTRNTGLTNWDAIVGVKGRASFGDGLKWFAPYYIDIGAGQSKFTWQATAGIGYSFPWCDVVGAWRYIDYQMKSGKAIESLTFSGPAVAAVFRW